MELTKYENYSREEVATLFSEEHKYTKGSGTWGLQGIVRIPSRVNDFVFFVTFGQKQGDHSFDEGVTENGVLTWQSQPSQTLTDSVIKKLIAHDDIKHNIYLFLRTKKDAKYTYLGLLKYLTHDISRERPVYFQWQIKDWEISDEITKSMGLVLEPSFEDVDPTSHVLPIESNTLELIEKFVFKGRREGTSTREFKAKKNPDYSLRDQRNRTLGLAGEELVIEYEKKRLISLDRPDLAEKVKHDSKILGDGIGYDVLSFDSDESERFIEVKTTKGGQNTAFFISSNEIEFSKLKKDNYYLYRVFEYVQDSKSGKLYIIEGALDEKVVMVPTQFIVSSFI